MEEIEVLLKSYILKRITFRFFFIFNLEVNVFKFLRNRLFWCLNYLKILKEGFYFLFFNIISININLK